MNLHCTLSWIPNKNISELKIRELKESIKEQRKLRDAVDELDDHVQKLNEKLNQFLQR